MAFGYLKKLFTDQETANEAFAYTVALILAVVSLLWIGRTPISGVLGLLTALYAAPYFRRVIGHDPGKWRVALYVLIMVLVFGIIGHFEATAGG